MSGRVISLNITSSLLGLANNDYGNDLRVCTMSRNYGICTHMCFSCDDGDDDDKVPTEDEDGYDILMYKKNHHYNDSSSLGFCAMCSPCEDDVFLDNEGSRKLMHSARYKEKYSCIDGSNRSILSSCRIQGELSPAIGSLKKLQVLSLPHNAFFGELPREISSLSSLEIINFRFNPF